jgi:transcriptional regulator with XRE-family HTH domain
MDAAATLIVHSADAVHRLGPERAPAVVGRGPDADVPVTDPRVGRAHVRLEFDRGRWRAVDNHSRTGMFVDGARRDQVDIEDGLTVWVGSPDGTAITFGLAHRDSAVDADADVPIDSGIARAGAAVAARRRELDITQRTLAKYRIMNAGALIAFEKGRSWPRERTRAKLEEVLQWPPGAIANIRNGGSVPGEQPASDPANDQAPLILGAVDVAMKTFQTAIEALPPPIDPSFVPRAEVILADLHQLEAVVARAAAQSRGMSSVVMALSAVRTRREELMLAAATAPNATLGQRLYAARRRANLSTAETANAIGVSADLIDSVESGSPATADDTAAITAFLVQLEAVDG